MKYSIPNRHTLVAVLFLLAFMELLGMSRRSR